MKTYQERYQERLSSLRVKKKTITMRLNSQLGPFPSYPAFQSSLSVLSSSLSSQALPSSSALFLLTLIVLVFGFDAFLDLSGRLLEVFELLSLLCAAFSQSESSPLSQESSSPLPSLSFFLFFEGNRFPL